MKIFFTLIILLILSRISFAASVCAHDNCLQVKVVTTKDDLAKGLQGVESLSDKEGMLFLFEKEGVYRFWMKGMKIAIDMLWLDSNGKILMIVPNRQPCHNEPCETYGPAVDSKYVLEVKSGLAGQLQLNVGDYLQISGLK